MDLKATVRLSVVSWMVPQNTGVISVLQKELCTHYSKDWKLSGMQQHVVAYRALVSSCKLLAWFPFAVGLIQVHKD